MIVTKDNKGYSVQAFSIAGGVTLPTSYTPTSNEVVCLAADVAITIDGITVTYLAGSIVGFVANATYTLGTATNAHKM